jgi:carbonic anhydrase/acetyltransferase-like protein (isoleucine patch superfamily)
MRLEHRGKRPQVAPDAMVAPDAVLRGDVVVGAGAAVLSGAILTAEGGPVRVGPECVIMEHAVLRGTSRHPLELGQAVLVGPHAHLSGCQVGEGSFLATRCTVFNGARLGERAEVRVSGVVHVNSRLPADAVVPIGWIAVGDPAQVLPPGDHEGIWALQEALDFPGTVFGAARQDGLAAQTRRYARALQGQRDDRILEDPGSERS